MNQATYSQVVVKKFLDKDIWHNPDYTTVLLMAEEYIKDAKTASLGGQGVLRKRTCFHPFHNSVIEKLNLKEGDNLVEKLQQHPEFSSVFANGGRISVQEITESEYNRLTEKQKKGWSPKSIPSVNGDSPKALYDDETGERIYHYRRFVAYGDKHWEDKKLKCFSLHNKINV